MKGEQKRGLQGEEKNLLSQVWFKYSPYWPLFLLLLIMTMAGAWAYIRYKTKPLFEATASILVKDEKKGQGEEKMIETINLLSAKKIIENEIEVIKSRELMAQVVKNLHLYAAVSQKGKIKSISLYTYSPVTIIAQDPDSLQASGNVFFTVDSLREMISFNNETYPMNEWVKLPGRVDVCSKEQRKYITGSLLFLNS
ncbi:MAG: hypothetical protein HC867_02680 [Bacteroidia bacterium]|nr:hypothetical protein [Bacteroidia bacterium]